MKFIALILITFCLSDLGYAGTEIVNLKIRTRAYDLDDVASSLDEFTTQIKLEGECGDSNIYCGKFIYTYEKDGFLYAFGINIIKYEDGYYEVTVGTTLGLSTVYLKNINDLRLRTETVIRPVGDKKSGRAFISVKTL